MNYPHGTTGRDIDSLCRTDNSYPNQQECVLCGVVIEQDPRNRGWFNPDECSVPYFPSDYLDAIETQIGWICSTACLEAQTEEGEIEPYNGLFLIRGGRA